MNVNFEYFFFYTIIACALIVLCDRLFLAARRSKKQTTKQPLIIEYARSFLPILLIVFSVRSFAFEAFRIPSGSLKPTLLIGDLILVNKYTYGIRLPVIHTKILALNEPKRGDIVVFREPPSENRDLIKRVIGIPGDRVSYKNKTLFINGAEISQAFDQYRTDNEDDMGPWTVVQKHENLLGITHDIYQIPNHETDDFEITVPEGKYFMMGDNRDVSADSRSWGFLPEKNIIGKATHVLLSYESIKVPVRLDRIAKRII